jgi:hypothetical protein
LEALTPAVSKNAAPASLHNTTLPEYREWARTSIMGHANNRLTALAAQLRGKRESSNACTHCQHLPIHFNLPVCPAAGGPPDLTKGAEIMQRHGLTPAQPALRPYSSHSTRLKLHHPQPGHNFLAADY